MPRDCKRAWEFPAIPRSFPGENRPADRGKSETGAIRPVRFLPGICHHQLGQLVRCCSDNAEHLSVNQKYVDAFLQNLGNTLG